MISGFILELIENDTWAEFGDYRKKVNIVYINKFRYFEQRKECGLLYIICELGPTVDDPHMTLDGLKANMVNYYLFLPYVYSKEDRYGREFVIIYDNWEMCNELGQT